MLSKPLDRAATPPRGSGRGPPRLLSGSGSSAPKFRPLLDGVPTGTNAFVRMRMNFLRFKSDHPVEFARQYYAALIYEEPPPASSKHDGILAPLLTRICTSELVPGTLGVFPACPLTPHQLKSKKELLVAAYYGWIMEESLFRLFAKLYHCPTAINCGTLTRVDEETGKTLTYVILGDPTQIGAIFNDPKGTKQEATCALECLAPSCSSSYWSRVNSETGQVEVNQRVLYIRTKPELHHLWGLTRELLVTYGTSFWADIAKASEFCAFCFCRKADQDPNSDDHMILCSEPTCSQGRHIGCFTVRPTLQQIHCDEFYCPEHLKAAIEARRNSKKQAHIPLHFGLSTPQPSLGKMRAAVAAAAATGSEPVDAAESTPLSNPPPTASDVPIVSRTTRSSPVISLQSALDASTMSRSNRRNLQVIAEEEATVQPTPAAAKSASPLVTLDSIKHQLAEPNMIDLEHHSSLLAGRECVLEGRLTAMQFQKIKKDHAENERQIMVDVTEDIRKLVIISKTGSPTEIRTPEGNSLITFLIQLILEAEDHFRQYTLIQRLTYLVMKLKLQDTPLERTIDGRTGLCFVLDSQCWYREKNEVIRELILKQRHELIELLLRPSVIHKSAETLDLALRLVRAKGEGNALIIKRLTDQRSALAARSTPVVITGDSTPTLPFKSLKRSQPVATGTRTSPRLDKDPTAAAAAAAAAAAPSASPPMRLIGVSTPVPSYQKKHGRTKSTPSVTEPSAEARGDVGGSVATALKSTEPPVPPSTTAVATPTPVTASASSPSLIDDLLARIEIPAGMNPRERADYLEAMQQSLLAERLHKSRQTGPSEAFSPDERKKADEWAQRLIQHGLPSNQICRGILPELMDGNCVFHSFSQGCRTVLGNFGMKQLRERLKYYRDDDSNSFNAATVRRDVAAWIRLNLEAFYGFLHVNPPSSMTDGHIAFREAKDGLIDPATMQYPTVPLTTNDLLAEIESNHTWRLWVNHDGGGSDRVMVWDSMPAILAHVYGIPVTTVCRHRYIEENPPQTKEECLAYINSNTCVGEKEAASFQAAVTANRPPPATEYPRVFLVQTIDQRHYDSPLIRETPPSSSSTPTAAPAASLIRADSSSSSTPATATETRHHCNDCGQPTTAVRPGTLDHFLCTACQTRAAAEPNPPIASVTGPLKVSAGVFLNMMVSQALQGDEEEVSFTPEMSIPEGEEQEDGEEEEEEEEVLEEEEKKNAPDPDKSDHPSDSDYRGSDDDPASDDHKESPSSAAAARPPIRYRFKIKKIERRKATAGFKDAFFELTEHQKGAMKDLCLAKRKAVGEKAGWWLPVVKVKKERKDYKAVIGQPSTDSTPTAAPSPAATAASFLAAAAATNAAAAADSAAASKAFLAGAGEVSADPSKKKRKPKTPDVSVLPGAVGHGERWCGCRAIAEDYTSYKECCGKYWYDAHGASPVSFFGERLNQRCRFRSKRSFNDSIISHARNAAPSVGDNSSGPLKEACYNGQSVCWTCFFALIGSSRSTFYKQLKKMQDERAPRKSTKLAAAKEAILEELANQAQFQPNDSGKRMKFTLPQRTRKGVYAKVAGPGGKNQVTSFSLTTLNRAFRELLKGGTSVSCTRSKAMCRCDTCERLQNAIADPSLKDEEKQKAKMDLEVHLDRQSKQRQAFNELKKEAMAHPEKLWTIMFDGMDQAKTRVPSRTRYSKELETLERINVHTVGAMCFGSPVPVIAVCHFQNTPKNAASTISTLEKILDRQFEAMDFELDEQGRPKAFARGAGKKKWPPRLHLVFDNTAAEAKNQHFFKYLGLLVLHGVFDYITVGNLMVGHTHDIVDQMFSVWAKALRIENAETWEKLRALFHKNYWAKVQAIEELKKDALWQEKVAAMEAERPEWEQIQEKDWNINTEKIFKETCAALGIKEAVDFKPDVHLLEYSANVYTWLEQVADSKTADAKENALNNLAAPHCFGIQRGRTVAGVRDPEDNDIWLYNKHLVDSDVTEKNVVHSFLGQPSGNWTTRIKLFRATDAARPEMMMDPLKTNPHKVDTDTIRETNETYASAKAISEEDKKALDAILDGFDQQQQMLGSACSVCQQIMDKLGKVGVIHRKTNQAESEDQAKHRSKQTSEKNACEKELDAHLREVSNFNRLAAAAGGSVQLSHASLIARGWWTKWLARARQFIQPAYILDGVVRDPSFDFSEHPDAHPTRLVTGAREPAIYTTEHRPPDDRIDQKWWDIHGRPEVGQLVIMRSNEKYEPFFIGEIVEIYPDDQEPEPEPDLEGVTASQRNRSGSHASRYFEPKGNKGKSTMRFASIGAPASTTKSGRKRKLSESTSTPATAEAAAPIVARRSCRTHRTPDAALAGQATTAPSEEQKELAAAALSTQSEPAGMEIGADEATAAALPAVDGDVTMEDAPQPQVEEERKIDDADTDMTVIPAAAAAALPSPCQVPASASDSTAATASSSAVVPKEIWYRIRYWDHSEKMDKDRLALKDLDEESKLVTKQREAKARAEAKAKAKAEAEAKADTEAKDKADADAAPVPSSAKPKAKSKASPAAASVPSKDLLKQAQANIDARSALAKPGWLIDEYASKCSYHRIAEDSPNHYWLEKFGRAPLSSFILWAEPEKILAFKNLTTNRIKSSVIKRIKADLGQELRVLALSVHEAKQAAVEGAEDTRAARARAAEEKKDARATKKRKTATTDEEKTVEPTKAASAAPTKKRVRSESIEEPDSEALPEPRVTRSSTGQAVTKKPKYDSNSERIEGEEAESDEEEDDTKDNDEEYEAPAASNKKKRGRSDSESDEESDSNSTAPPQPRSRGSKGNALKKKQRR